MQKATEQDLIRRLLSHIEHGTTDLASHERTVWGTGYTDSELLRQELQRVLRARPLIIGHSSQLSEPGDFITDEVFGLPVVVVRGPDGALRAHVNVCRHRGARLVEAASGSGIRAFSCPYHGWGYSLQGDLTHVTDGARCFPDLKTAQRGLLRAHAWEQWGFVWLDANPDALDGLDGGSSSDRLAPLDGDFDGYRLGDDSAFGGATLTGAFNWKLGVEAFLEVYHFRSLHPGMRNYVFTPEVAAFDQLGEHMRLVAPKKEVRDLAKQPSQTWSLRPKATVVYHIFPSTFVFVEKRHSSTLQIRPVAVDRSEVRIMHIAREDGLRRLSTLERNIELFMRAVGEDIGACESIQRGLASVPQELIFGRNELGIHHFRDNLDRLLDT